MLVSVLLLAAQAEAKINLPAHFSHHMVLQQNSSVPIWGWAACSEEITISPSWNNTPVTTCSNNQASWTAELATPPAGGPYSIMIRGERDSLLIRDVLVGEVWLASGQSNMEWSAAKLEMAQEEIDEANFPSIRLFQVEKRTAAFPQQDVKGQWKVCTPSSMKDFSAVAYYFARKLHKELNVPIGVILSSWGGTGAEVWLNSEVLSEDQELMEAAKLVPKNAFGPNDPGVAYNSMIAPLIPFRIAGTIWYQGESNRHNHFVYEKLFCTLMKDWREEWGSNFPFYYVQIAPFSYDTPLVGVKIREAQLNCLSLPNTGMVVTSDIGDIELIHPPNKKDVGLRLANWALARTYHFEDIAYSGPLYREMKIEGSRVRVLFDHAKNGLVCRGQELTNFQIAGRDSVFVDAKAVIEGGSVMVFSPEIQNPKAVRFAWSNIAEPNLFNKEGLPASCFCSDNWK